MNRNYGIDFLKFICTFMVICIHTMSPNNVGNIIIPISRIAVPIFFMITGYFYSVTKNKNGQKKQIRKIFKYVIYANIVYLIYNIFICVFQNISVLKYLTEIFNIKKIIKFIFFNESPFSGHLWYLSALLYVLIIVYLWEKKFNIEKLYRLIPILLLMDLILGKYSILIFKRTIPYVVVRNFLCVGLPYFLIGDLLFKNQTKIVNKSYVSVGLIIFFSITTLLEKYFLEYYNINAVREHYISTTFLSILFFLLIIKYDNIKTKKTYKVISVIGGKISFLIYIIHPMIIDFFKPIVVNNNMNTILVEWYNLFLPVIVFGISIIISYIIYYIRYNLKKVND